MKSTLCINIIHMLDVKSTPELPLPQGLALDAKFAFVVFVACVLFACYLEYDTEWKSQITNYDENHKNNKLKVYYRESNNFERVVPVFYKNE